MSLDPDAIDGKVRLLATQVLASPTTRRTSRRPSSPTMTRTGPRSSSKLSVISMNFEGVSGNSSQLSDTPRAKNFLPNFLPPWRRLAHSHPT
jgi:hypothetical protein